MAPNYTLGHAWSLGAIAICLCLWFVLRQIYYKREGLKEQVRSGTTPAPEHFSDRSPDYKYQH